MNRQELRAAFLSTLDDQRVSSGERRALTQVLEERPPSASERVALQGELFEMVRERVHDSRDKALLSWLEGALKVLRPLELERSRAAPRAFFGPEDPMVETLVRAVGGTRTSLDVAVFTLTDDRLSEQVIAAHRRGVRVRILSDNDKAWDRGSDIQRLQRAGVPLKVDRSPHHFHHKFAVLDGETLINGSYNWTRGADRDNRENFLILHDERVVARYQRAFNDLWEAIA